MRSSYVFLSIKSLLFAAAACLDGYLTYYCPEVLGGRFSLLELIFCAMIMLEFPVAAVGGGIYFVLRGDCL